VSAYLTCQKAKVGHQRLGGIMQPLEIPVWTDECEACFEDMKRRLTTAPVLAIPDTTKMFEVYCDASYQGLGCVLM